MNSEIMNLMINEVKALLNNNKEIDLDRAYDLAKHAAKHGAGDVLAFLFMNAFKVGKDDAYYIRAGIAEEAASNGHLHILMLLKSLGYNYIRGKTMTVAAKEGHKNCVEYLREVCEIDWQPDIFYSAAKRGRLSVMSYLLSAGCPWDKKNTQAVAQTLAENGKKEVLDWIHANNLNEGLEENKESIIEVNTREYLDSYFGL